MSEDFVKKVIEQEGEILNQRVEELHRDDTEYEEIIVGTIVYLTFKIQMEE